jgi:hypothetical protein
VFLALGARAGAQLLPAAQVGAGYKHCGLLQVAPALRGPRGKRAQADEGAGRG